MAVSGVYTITNTRNSHRYVGSGVDVSARWRHHQYELRTKIHHSPYLQRAWDKWGSDVFRFELLEGWEPEFLVSMEQWWMNMLHPEYNICPMARSPLGLKRSRETKAKMSAGAKKFAARGRHKMTLESKAKLSAAMMGHEVTPETKVKLSVANKGHMPWHTGMTPLQRDWYRAVYALIKEE